MVKWDGTKHVMIGTARAVGLVAQEGETISVSQVCVGVRVVLRGEVGDSDRRRCVRYVSGRITSGMIRTGDWSPPCVEFPRQKWTPRGGPDLPGILTKISVADPVPGRGVPVWGVKSDQPPDSLCTPPRAGKCFDPGGD